MIGQHILTVGEWMLDPLIHPYWLIGIVRNDHPFAVTAPEVSIRMHTMTGTPALTLRAPTLLARLLPGQVSPFRVRIPADIDAARVQIGSAGCTSGVDTVSDLALTRAERRHDDVFQMQGVVQVPAGLHLHHVVVVGAWYTAANTLCATTLQILFPPYARAALPLQYHLRVRSDAVPTRWDVCAQGIHIGTKVSSIE